VHINNHFGGHKNNDIKNIKIIKKTNAHKP